MRRILAVLLVVLVLFVASPASAQAGDDRSPRAQTTEQTGNSAPVGGTPSIIPDPDERGTNNFGGLVVGVVLLGGWAALGAVLFLQGKRRRELRQA